MPVAGDADTLSCSCELLPLGPIELSNLTFLFISMFYGVTDLGNIPDFFKPYAWACATSRMCYFDMIYLLAFLNWSICVVFGWPFPPLRTDWDMMRCSWARFGFWPGIVFRV